VRVQCDLARRGDAAAHYGATPRWRHSLSATPRCDTTARPDSRPDATSACSATWCATVRRGATRGWAWGLAWSRSVRRLGSEHCPVRPAAFVADAATLWALGGRPQWALAVVANARCELTAFVNTGCHSVASLEWSRSHAMPTPTASGCVLTALVNKGGDCTGITAFAAIAVPATPCQPFGRA
jgi:hypothetical protein